MSVSNLPTGHASHAAHAGQAWSASPAQDSLPCPRTGLTIGAGVGEEENHGARSEMQAANGS